MTDFQWIISSHGSERHRRKLIELFARPLVRRGEKEIDSFVENSCNFRERSDVLIHYELDRQLHEFGRAGPDCYSVDYTGLVWSEKITGAGAGNGPGGKRI